MKLMHHIDISVFVKDGEDEKVIAESIAQFLPEDFVEEGIVMEIEPIHIDQGEDITVLRVHIEKERHTKFVFEVLREYLGEEQAQLIASQENRVDPKGKLYIRLDKKIFLEENKATLVDHGDCIHFTIMLAAFPKNRERALLVAKELFS